MEFVNELLASPLLAWVVVGVGLAAFGWKAVPAISKLPESRWRSVYLQTAWLHPFAGGALVGLLDLPVPDGMGGSLAGSVLWYFLAGALGLPLYLIAKRWLDRKRRDA